LLRIYLICLECAAIFGQLLLRSGVGLGTIQER
jgi:hypothetical protein